MTEFVHLHLHTEYSLLDGACRIRDLFHAVKKAGQTAVAITDHGVLYGAVSFYKEALAHGIKPIIGCEVYVAPGSRFQKEKTAEGQYSHLVLLCENETGYQNLIRLVSASFTEGFYTKPRVDHELLSAHHEGLIALSACLAGLVPKRLAASDYAGAKEEAMWYSRVFGPDHYYLELQDHGLPAQARVNAQLLKLSRETGIPLVATNDVHYIEQSDSAMQQVLICLQTGKKLGEDHPLLQNGDQMYLKTGDEMAALFAYAPEAVANTVSIARRCSFAFEFGKIKLPHFDIGRQDHALFFKQKCEEGLYRLYGPHPDETVVKRLAYELDVIEKMGYVDYYLIVWDFVRYAKEHDIPVGPGRGSGAGSLAAYCMGITGIDPIKYDLLFERFLNPERVSMPDFDIDFCYVKRQQVIDYVVEKYGSDRVAQIVTFGTLAARNAVRDVGRVMDLPYATCDKVAKLVPRDYHTDLKTAVEKVPLLNEMYRNDPAIRRLLDMAMKVEGMPRHASTHAAGVVISAGPIWQQVPLSKNDDAVVTQYTMTALDELGLLKMDFLGLRNLTVIDDTVKFIRRTDPAFTADTIPENDPETLAMMAAGHTEGVFQFESTGMVKVLRRFRPENLEDLIAIISLYRPGPMDAIPTYIHNRFHPEDIRYATPLLEPILGVTYGCIVYQEQVMQICRHLAGYSLGRADLVRRAMAKKKPEVMEAQRQIFVYGQTDENGTVTVPGAVRNGVSEEAAHKIFDDMASFASYAFNKSHAAAYGYLAYQTAYLKRHYGAPYMAALLTSVMESAEKLVEYVNECRRLGIPVLPPSVNQSEEGFCAEKTGVRFGLLTVKNIGRAFVEKIVEQRRRRPFTSLYDFCVRTMGRWSNRRALEALIKSGALDGLEANRRSMLQGLDNVLEAAESRAHFEAGGQMDLFGNYRQQDRDYHVPAVAELPEEQCLAAEKEVCGLYVTGHPLKRFEGYRQFCRAARVADVAAGMFGDNSPVKLVVLLSEVKLRTLKSGQVMCQMVLEDLSGSVEAICFASVFEPYKHLLQSGRTVCLFGKVSVRDDQPPEVVVQRCEELPGFADGFVPPRRQITKKLYVQVPCMEAPVVETVNEILKANHGEMPVFFYDRGAKKTWCAHERLWADDTTQLLTALKDCLGKDNVKIVGQQEETTCSNGIGSPD